MSESLLTVHQTILGIGSSAGAEREAVSRATTRSGLFKRMVAAYNRQPKPEPPRHSHSELMRAEHTAGVLGIICRRVVEIDNDLSDPEARGFYIRQCYEKDEMPHTRELDLLRTGPGTIDFILNQTIDGLLVEATNYQLSADNLLLMAANMDGDKPYVVGSTEAPRGQLEAVNRLHTFNGSLAGMYVGTPEVQVIKS